MPVIKTYLRQLIRNWQMKSKLLKTLMIVNDLAPAIVSGIEIADRRRWGDDYAKTSRDEGEGFSTLESDIIYTFWHFSLADDYLSDSEINMYHEIQRLWGVVDYKDVDAWHNDHKFRQEYRENLIIDRKWYQKDADLLCLPHLLEYDKVNKTDYLEKARMMFLKLAAMVIEIDGEATKAEAEALARFKSIIYWQYNNIRPTKDTSRLRKILCPVSELASAIDSMRQRNQRELEEDDGSTPLRGIDTLMRDIRYVFHHFGWIDNDLSDEEVELHFEIEIILGTADPYLITKWQISSEFRQIFKKIGLSGDLYREEKQLFCLEYLQSHDKLHNTDYLEKARNMFFALATEFIEVDSRVTEDETRALARFKSMIWRENTSVFADALRLQEQIGSSSTSNKTDPPAIIMGRDSDATDGSGTVRSTTNKQDPPFATLPELLDNLDSLIGLGNIKNEVVQLVNFLRVQQIRQSKGMEAISTSRHLVFYGNPGTGKTTVARLLAKIYKSLNIISSGHLIETDRTGLVAGYIGQTALKTQEVVKQAIGGVLFIDEAYTLASEGQDFGHEAIDTLIKMMEDNRNDLIVIVAGYTDEMSRFLSSNPGLKSRFNKYFYFEDYDAPQLVGIFELFCRKAEFNLSNSARAKLLKIFESHYAIRDKAFGNARLARNIFEHTINKQANRVIALGDITDVDLITILDVDIPDV